MDDRIIKLGIEEKTRAAEVVKAIGKDLKLNHFYDFRFLLKIFIKFINLN